MRSALLTPVLAPNAAWAGRSPRWTVSSRGTTIKQVDIGVRDNSGRQTCVPIVGHLGNGQGIKELVSILWQGCS